MRMILRALRAVICAVILAGGVMALPQAAQAQVIVPGFSKTFSPDDIGPGGTSTLTFTIDNSGGGPVTGLAFSDVLPAAPGAMTIATPANASTSCADATLSAPAGGGTISLSGGRLGAGGICTVSVNVTAAAVGTYINVSGALTSSAGNSGTARDDLTVATNLPGFSKGFSPSTVALGGRSTLTFTIDNSLGTGRIGNLDFTDNLPIGIVVAGPANAVTNCISASVPNTTLTAVPGTGQIILDANGNIAPAGFEVLSAGATCTVDVDVVGTAVGLQNNSVDLLADFTAAGSAVATLEVTADDKLQITKAFTDDPVAPGGVATLEFTLRNADRNFPATGVSFSDELDTMLSGATVGGTASFNDCGGSGGGTGTFSYSGGTIGPEGSCTIRIPVTIPAGAGDGGFVNTTSTVTGTINGSTATGDPASDTLFVSGAIPDLQKSFTASSITAGDLATMQFTITNGSSTQAATNLAFTDNISAFLSGTTVASLPATGFCGAGAIAFANVSGGDTRLNVSGASLPAGGSCTFNVAVTTPANTPGGTYTNITSQITGTVGGAPVVGPPDDAILTVNGGVNLNFTKSFTSGAAMAGGTATLEFVIDNTASTTTVTGLAFSDDLASMLLPAGAQFTGATANTCDGMATSGFPTSNFGYAGGRVAGGSSCRIALTMSVPAATATGSYTNTSQPLTGDAGVGDDAAVASLNVLGTDDQPPVLTKEFIGGPFLPGETATLRFTIANNNAVSDITDIFFTDNLSASLSGLAAVGPLPSAPCGPSSALTGTTFLIFVGGSVDQGAPPCSFDVSVLVPAGAANGSYGNITSAPTATVGVTAGVVGNQASDTLVVEASQLGFTKAFANTSATAGSTEQLSFTLTNSTSQPITNLAFTDDLDAMLSGAVATGLPLAACGGTFSGTGTISFSGGSLASGSSCLVNIPVSLPAGAGTSMVTNTTSVLSGNTPFGTISGPAASDTLQVIAADAPGFSKAFAGTVFPGEAVSLSFTIDNSANASAVLDVGFTDDLDAMLTGASLGSVTSNSCGGTVSGTGLMSLSGGTVAAGASCTLTVAVQAPLGAAAGSYLNTTSPLSVAGLTVAPAATASLTVEPVFAPVFAKAFAPSAVRQGDVSTMSFTIDNAANGVAAANLAFTDAFPAGLEVATPANLNNGCGGTFTAAAGATDVSLTGGTVAASGTCLIEVDVLASGTGALSNTTSTLTSSLPTATAASATLTVSAPGAPVFSKAFTPDTVRQGGVSTMSFTIDNAANGVAAANLAFTDAFPAGLEVADPANLNNGCGGTFTAAAGATDVSLTGGTVAASGTCLIEVDVLASGTGALSNTTSALTSSAPTATAASATLTVNATGAPVFSKAFTPDTVRQGGVSTMSFTIDNSANTVLAADLAFTDTFPAGLEVADPANLDNACGGTFTAAAGATDVSLTGGTVGVGASCLIEVDVRATSSEASVTNTTSALTSTAPDAAPASATLNINAAAAPGFAKVFAPDVIAQGEITTLSFTIDNSANVIEAAGLSFDDPLPAGLVVASPAAVSNSCGGTLTAAAGATTLSLASGTVAAGDSCSISVNVQGQVAGTFENVTSALSTSLGEAAAASDRLTVNALPLSVTMGFAPGTIEQSSTAVLSYTLSNAAQIGASTVILTDNLPADVSIATPGNAGNTCGGSLSAADGGSTVALTGGTVAAGGSCTVSVSVTSAVVGDYPNSTETVSSSLGISAAASATLVVEPATSGTLTIVQNTDTDGAYGFSSATTALNFVINTAGGTGSRGPITLPAGTHVLQQATPDGVGNTAITCTDDDSVGQPRERMLTISIDPAEAVTCTYTSISSRQKTVDTINRFLTKRADLILSSEPSNARRINRLKRGAGGSTALRFSNGDLNSFLPFTAQISTASENYTLSTSFLQMQQAAASLALAHGDQRGVRHIPNYRWDAWFEAQYKKFDAGNDSGHFAIAYFGADYLVSENLLVGALFQVDDMEDDNASLSTSVNGTGWMVGPYMTARLAPNLYFDGRVAVGTSRNDISPFNTYVDEFTTDRWMAMAGITGDFQQGNWTIQPGASLSYFEETQNAYVDGIGVLIPSQTVSLGQIKVGPTVSGQFMTQGGMGYAPYMSLDAIYNFGDTKGVTVTNPDTAVTDGWRGRVQAGVDFSLRNGTSISFGGSYDGIGRDSLEVWGANLRIEIPIQKATAK